MSRPRRAVAVTQGPQEQARAALAAVLARLPDARPGTPLARVALEASTELRDALVAVVSEAAFALCASARGLVRAPADAWRDARGDAPPVAWPLPSDLLAVARQAALAALAEQRTVAELAALAADDLGAFYEGLLAVGIELASRDSVIVAEPRPAGGAAVERLVPAGAEKKGERARQLVPAGRIALLDTVQRRRAGAHYTPRALTERVVADTLGPLLGATPAPDEVLALRVCDPAMGTGALLVAACRYLAGRLVEAEARTHAANGSAAATSESREPPPSVLRGARRRIAEHCLFGVDRDALAVAVAREALWLEVADPELPFAALASSLLAGEALLGAPQPAGAASPPARVNALDWPRAFPAVFADGGFHAFIGNPPWVSYAGRAAQPLADELRARYAAYEAFHGYKNLQGLFVERAARLLRPGGRLGLVLPSSMSELAGYAPTRRAHDRFCEPDPSLPDLGAAAFDGVFQPCMVLSSTRRAAPLEPVPARAWPVERPDLDAVAHGLIDKLTRAPLPPHLFGERGLQSSGPDAAHLAARPDARHSVPLRSGSDIEAFGLRPPSAYADPAWFGPRLRAAEEWARVRFVVRQTARVPVAALSDGVAFRNSLLAGFDDAEHPAEFLVAYLNSTPIRWLHHARHRDARQGMPQLKIAHLRATPAPPSGSLVSALAALGARLSARGGIRAEEQAELDTLVADAFGLDAEERRRLVEFSANVADARAAGCRGRGAGVVS